MVCCSPTKRMRKVVQYQTRPWFTKQRTVEDGWKGVPRRVLDGVKMGVVKAEARILGAAQLWFEVRLRMKKFVHIQTRPSFTKQRPVEGGKSERSERNDGGRWWF